MVTKIYHSNFNRYNLETEPLLDSAAIGSWNIQFHSLTLSTVISVIVVLLLLLSSALISGSEVAYFSLSASQKQKLKKKSRINNQVLKNLDAKIGIKRQ